MSLNIAANYYKVNLSANLAYLGFLYKKHKNFETKNNGFIKQLLKSNKLTTETLMKDI